MFGRAITLFKLLGFDIRIHVSWAIIAMLVTWTLAVGYFPLLVPNLAKSTYWTMGVAGAFGLFTCIILHELGHAVMARRHGIRIKGITLFIFGGVAEMEAEPPSAKSEFVMAIGGPVVTAVLAVSFFILYQASWPDPARAVLWYLSWINGLLLAFNMLPAFPLDGGRVLRSYLWSRKGDLRKATRTASRVGSGFGAALIGLGVFSVFMGNFIGGMWWFLIGMFLRGASQMSYRQVEVRQLLEGEPVRRFMRTEPVVVAPSISLEELVQDYVYKHHYEMFPVMEDSELLGCVSTKEVKDVPREQWRDHTVREVLKRCSADNSVSPDADAVKVLQVMRKTSNGRLMVLDHGRLVGIITLKDLMRFLALKLDLEGGEEAQPQELASLTK